MEYQKIINLLDDTTNQPSKLCVEINDELRGMYHYNCDINFKTLLIRLSLCDYSDTCVHVKATKTVPNTAAQLYII